MIGWGEARTIFVRRKNYDELNILRFKQISKLIQLTPNDQMSVGIHSKINKLEVEIGNEKSSDIENFPVHSFQLLKVDNLV